MLLGQLVGDFGEYPAAPLRDLLAFTQQGGFEHLQEKEAHIILQYHLLHDIINIGIELLHQLINLIKLPLHPLDQNMRQILIIVRKQSNRLFSGEVQVGHQLVYDVLEQVALWACYVVGNLGGLGLAEGELLFWVG